MDCYQTAKTPGDTEWFVQDRFGMFIHWGLYAMPARHEWVKTRERMSEEKYDRYFKYFNPDLYNPSQWAQKAKAAGMRYAIFTSKHHEGFCMWDSAYTDYKVTNTPAKRDILKEYVEAFRAEGLKVGFYYSLLDWHHPHFTIDRHHPRREDQDAFELNQDRDMKIYAKYMRNQVTELLSNYGKIDILWFDFSYSDYHGEGAQSWMRGKGKEDWEAEKLIKLVRSLQPNIMINNRTGIEQDIWTPEQYQPLEWLRHPKTNQPVVWEACQTFSGSWGYDRDEQTWKSPKMLIEMLINTVALGGNLLMNVGPTARGNFDYRATAALEVYEQWMQLNGRAIYGCTMAEPEFYSLIPKDCRFTQSQDGKRLYIHLFSYPFAHLQLPGFAGKVDYIQFLHDGSELTFSEGMVEHFSEGATKADDLLVINLPPVKPNIFVPVIEVFLK